MKLSDLKRKLDGYNFELLHGIMETGGIHDPELPVSERFNYSIENPNEIFCTSILQMGYKNEIFGIVGIIVEDAELLRFKPHDCGRQEMDTKDQIISVIDPAEIAKYLDSYDINSGAPYCDICISDVQWGNVFINFHDYRYPSHWVEAVISAKNHNKSIEIIDQDWKLTLVK